MIKNKTLVLLAGGLGSRISEETYNKPKPMIKIGNMPMIWHIMKYYSQFKVNRFIILAGYKSEVIKEFFLNYHYYRSSFSINLNDNKIKILEKHNGNKENWDITILDTGDETNTGGRIIKAEQIILKIDNEKDFLLTYSDGLSNINLNKLYLNHLNKKKLVSVTAVKPPGRFGSLNIDSKNLVTSFVEKPEGDNSYISGGFFVCSKNIFKYFSKSNSIFESDILPKISKKKQITAFKHKDFWQPLDTLRDYKKLKNLWESKKAPWKIWK